MMLTYFTIYAKVNCPFCVEAINLMNKHGLHHVLVLVDQSEDYYTLLKRRYEHNTVPIITQNSRITGEDMQFIGGCDDFKKFLKDQGYEEC